MAGFENYLSETENMKALFEDEILTNYSVLEP